MRIEYFPETDSLYIELASRAGVDTREIDDGIVVDVDGEGHLVGIDILAALPLLTGRNCWRRPAGAALLARYARIHEQAEHTYYAARRAR